MKKIALLLLPFLLTACTRDLSQYVYGNEDPTRIGASFYIPKENAKTQNPLPANVATDTLGLFDIPLGASPKDVLGFLPDEQGVYQGSMVSLEGLPAIGFFSLDEAGKIKTVGLHLEDHEVKASLQALLDKGYKPALLRVDETDYILPQIEAEQGNAKAGALVVPYLQDPAKYRQYKIIMVFIQASDYANVLVTGALPLQGVTSVTFARIKNNVIIHHIVGAK